MASATEPMKGRHGVLLYSAQSSKGTAVTPATAVGLASVDRTSDSGMTPVYGLGSPNALFFKPGVARVDFNISIAQLQTKAFLEQAVRTSGVLPYFTLGCGFDPDSGTSYAAQIQDCKIHSFDFAADQGGPASCSFTGVGGAITDLTSLSAANLSETPLWFYEGVMLKGGSAYEINGIRVNVNHNVDVQSVIPGAAPSSFKRGWSYQTEGLEVVTGEITRFTRSSINLQGDTISDFALQIAFTDIAGGMTPNSLTLALADAKFGAETQRMSPDGDIVWTTPFMAKTWSVS